MYAIRSYYAYIGIGKDHEKDAEASNYIQNGPINEKNQVEFKPLEHLQTRSLTYRYPETGRGIHNIDLNLTRGSFTVITGMIGSGIV